MATAARSNSRSISLINMKRLFGFIAAFAIAGSAFAQLVNVPGGKKALGPLIGTPTANQGVAWDIALGAWVPATYSGSYTAPTGTGFPHITSGTQDAASIGETGSGNVVRATSPTLVTPTIGFATATSVNGTAIPSSKTLVVTTDTVNALAPSTSANLATLLSDETGSGASVFGTSPTITTPTISGAIAFPDGVRQTFNPDGTTPGLNVGAQAGDPSSLSNGDIWYNSTGNTLRARINGATVSLGAGGGGLTSADIDTSSELAAILTDETGTGASVFANTPTLITPNIGAATGTSLALSGAASSASLAVSGNATVGGSITVGGVEFGTTLSSDDTYAGIIRSGFNNSGGVTQWDAVYLNSSSQWVLADANGSGTYPAQGLAVATVATGNATTVITRGTVRNDAWNWTVGGLIYLSTTAGGLTQTPPSTAGDKVQVMGYALNADTMAVNISDTYTTVGATLTDTTFDSQATGNVLKMIDYKDFVYPHKVDGTGATIVTNDYTSALSGLATYAGTGGTNANYAWYRIGTVPNDLDTATAMVLKALAIRVSGTDTASASFSICYFSPASSSAFSPSDFTAGSGYVTTTTGTLTSPAANDTFYLSDVTLTGWASGLTAGRPFIIGIARDGGDSNNDSITVLGATISYGRTQ
jgi:hypothetical protein